MLQTCLRLKFASSVEKIIMTDHYNCPARNATDIHLAKRDILASFVGPSRQEQPQV